MEVVEVNEIPCRSDVDEVVLLDMDKTNGVQDSPEMHKLNVEEEIAVRTLEDTADKEVVIQEQQGDNSGTNGMMEVVETCDDSIQDDQMEIVDESMCNSTVVVNSCSDSHEPELNVSEMTIVDENGQKLDCIVIDNNQEIEVENNQEITVENNQEIEVEIGNNQEIEVEIENNQIFEDENNQEVEVVELANASVTEDMDTSTNESEIKGENTNESLNTDQTMEQDIQLYETKNTDGTLVVKKNQVTVTIPQHIAGRDISSLTEETLPRSGKRMLKPRFGVKVPYIHMTSQIVTQDEIAKELFERFQQKYPITRVDKPDKLFSMKLTHRLANKISPLKTPDGKSKDSTNTSNKSSKKLNIKKELSNKKLEKIDAGTTSKSVENSQSPSSNVQLSNNVSKESIQDNDSQSDSQHIDQITNTLKSLDQSADQSINNISDDKNDEKISSNEELIAILEDFEVIETADTNGNKVPELPKPVVKKKIIRSTTRTKRSKPKLDPEIEKQIALKQLQEVSRPKRFDSHFAKRKAETEKKLLPKADLGSAQKRKKPGDVPEVKIAIDQYIKSYTDKRQSTVKLEPTFNDETASDNIEEVESEPKTNEVAKARTMREINRLLGDEGAINMIYSLEKRRSPGNNNSKNILPSTRRKKKDLMLKTKLVKNAMLKMSSPASTALSSNRLGRRSDVCTPSLTPENKCTRKTSLDSQGSDQSVKSLGNFSGRKIIPADESKIIRKHSSSSEASSVGGSPIHPIPVHVPIDNVTTKHAPVKPLRVYTRKNKTSDDILLNLDDQPFTETSKVTNKSCAKTKAPVSQKVKKQSLQVSKLSKSLAESIKQEVEDTKYNEITIRRYDGVVHITLTPVSTVMKNALNISVMKELIKELNNLENDDTCKVVLVSSAGRIFCQGLDIAPLIHHDPVKCKEAAIEISSVLKKFISSLSNFPKLLVAGVDGAAVGLGATMLVHFDLVFASDKATFETPYAQLGHIAEGAATTILGRLLVAEMIIGNQRLTAGQAHYYGLVTRTLWPDRFHDELIPLVKSLARQSLQAMKTSKALQKQETKDKLAKSLESETHILVQQWTGDECQQNLQTYLKDAVDNINT